MGQLRGDLIQMQGSITRHNTNLQRVRNLTVQNSQRYHGTVAAINSRLQVGTTPGNPVLVSQWNAAQVQLDQISGDIARMNTLANGVASDSAMAGYLLESTRATYGLTGAVDEDHRQLAILEDEVKLVMQFLAGRTNVEQSRRSLAGGHVGIQSVNHGFVKGQEATIYAHVYMVDRRRVLRMVLGPE